MALSVRPITADQTHAGFVVDERLVIKWLRAVDDADHPALRALSHLEAVGFSGMPRSFGALTRRAPSGREVPIAFLSAYLPGAVDGWSWCVAALEAGEPFAASLGELVAELHVALATPSPVVPSPLGVATPADWHAGARSLLDELARSAPDLDDAAAGPDGQAPRVRASSVIAGARAELTAAVDALLTLPPVRVQPIHGDLHVGQVLRHAGGLAVIDFDGNPVLPPEQRAAFQPAARDLAQMLLSLDQVARIADRRRGWTTTAAVDAWSTRARAGFLAAYRAALARADRPDLLDERLIRPFLAEQAARDLVYSARHLPRWAYATVDGLPTLLGT